VDTVALQANTRAYADYVLGDVIYCENEGELRTRGDWLETEASRGRDLDRLERNGLEKLRSELLCSAAKDDPDVHNAPAGGREG
jgi:hypothetical protein